MVRAGLQGDVERRSPCLRAGLFESVDLGVGSTQLQMGTLSYHLAIPNQNRPDERIGTYPASSTPRLAQGPAHVDRLRQLWKGTGSAHVLRAALPRHRRKRKTEVIEGNAFGHIVV